MSTAQAQHRSDRILLNGVSWDEYGRYLRAFAERRRVRLTYDRGVLEIISPLSEHEFQIELLALLVQVLTTELGLPRRAGGSMTLRRRRRQRGLEPDRCWWIASAPRLRPGVRINLRVNPPPDLALEVDVTSSSLNRLRIYAALGVPEVWRLTDQGLAFYILEAGAYQIRTHSLAFPQISSADLVPFLAQAGQAEDGAIEQQFRAWLRQRLASQPPSPSQP